MTIIEDLAQKLELRDQYRDQLMAIRNEIIKLNTLHIDPVEAEKVRILQHCTSLGQYMSLEIESQDGPYFFTPYLEDVNVLKDPDDPGYQDAWPTDNPQIPNHANVYGLSAFIGDYMFESLLEYPPGIYSKSWGNLNFSALFESVAMGIHWKAHRRH
ncbi:hypothetical protein BDV25DRAFT_47973 [Aspergillus avenaceus]|uniref:Uncharacterized protein n=1 Tax=Aspergillus avenaceus TaxID=36643 RepID=A0A5N6U347_ASPAV|nr:hypothetical protein BDV25DRAFT_47973 [Aspergillus avenaceus]